ncbi:uncharacterized protein LOC106648139 [Trichogramma pretiosum]|uniref:uncharacterized protein LOC106648139 n=1 Tax=Trichogramma pretiosum TaxID=7493 RepID=UPI0006C94866|nr:uncharacterized protein LOC106648139 [Trichogramma pretiosum]
MRIAVLALTCLLVQGLTLADEVEVVEALTNDDGRNQSNSDQQDIIMSSDNEVSGSSSSVSIGSGTSQYSPPNMRLPPVRAQLPSRHNNGGGGGNNNAYPGPPPPPPASSQRPILDSIDKIFDTAIAASTTLGDNWPAPSNDMPKIVSLDVKCEKNSMKVYLAFDKPFYGIVFSKGHYSNVNCVYLPAGLGRTSVNFEIGIHACGTAGNTDNGIYGYGAVESGSGTYFENIVVIQYDPQVQEVWDQARKLRCTWHDLYEKSVTFRPFPVDMLDVVRADFAGDNVGCWMQIQVGKGPWASEVSGLVKIGQTMTMVLAIKDDDSKFDMLVRNCMAHDGKRAPIQLVDQRGCITRPKLMSRFTKIKNFGASASVLSYAHFQAFKFPDSMEVHFQCTIQICRYHCPDQCSDSAGGSQHDSLLLEQHHRASIGHTDVHAYGIPPPPLPIDAYLQSVGTIGRPRDERRRKSRSVLTTVATPNPEKTVGVNRVIRVVSTGDLTFSIDESSHGNDSNVSSSSANGAGGTTTMVFPIREATHPANLICMTTSSFVLALLLLLGILLASCCVSAYLCLRLRPFRKRLDAEVVAFRAFPLGGVSKTPTLCSGIEEVSEEYLHLDISMLAIMTYES